MSPCDTTGCISEGAVRRSRLGLLVTTMAFLALATAWNVLIPPFENLDELEHFEVVRHLATTGRLPVHDVADAAGFRVRQEASQPPLYYYLASAWAKLLALPLDPPDVHEVPGDLVACGSPDVPYNRATWLHHPFRDAGPPWSGTLRTLHSLRFLSTLLQLATLCGCWALARRIRPRGPFPALVTGVVAFNPQFLLLASGVNNDNAVIPLATWGLVLAHDLSGADRGRLRPAILGVVCGAAALSKFSGFALLGLAALVLLLRWVQRTSTFGRTLTDGLVTAGSAVAVVSPWLIRNARLYGDLTALGPMLAKVGRRATPIDWGEARLMGLSYWGQLPCSFYPRGIYWPYMILVVGGLIGAIAALRSMGHRARILLTLSTFWLLVIIVAYLRWTSLTPASGGRLLFPAAAAVALLVMTGWRHLSRTLAAAWGALLPTWSIVALLAGPTALLLPPSTTPVRTAQPEQLVAVFDDALGLTRYTAEVHTPRIACALVSRTYCGPTLELTLDWTALRQVTADYIVVVQLVDAAPGSTRLRLNYNYWPGRGNLRTSTWPPDRVIHDRYTLPLPHYEGVTQAWNLTLALVDPATGARLPVTTPAAPADTSVILTRLRVPDEQPTAPGWGNRATPATFGEHITLIDAGLERESESWRVMLLWESLAPVGQDLVAFVHAYDSTGEPIATGDAPPLNGAFATSYWSPGDRILTSHTLALPADTDVVAIGVGLYEPTSGARMAASAGGDPLANDTVIVWSAEE